MTDPNLRFGHLDWTSGMSFTASSESWPSIVIDGNGKEGPGPMVTLLLAAAGCSGSDVVSILEKMQVKLTSFSVDVTGRRNEEMPRRYNALTLVFRLAGEGLTQAKADRAVELSVSKYCSVMLSLNPDIPIRTEVILEG
ncbi:MAG: OsmC family protein [Gemmatimonadales bacterium]